MRTKRKIRYVLGVHLGHDSTASLICDGKVVASAQEERFTRNKHYCFCPTRAVEFCLKSADITTKDIDLLTFPSIGQIKELEVLFNLKKQDLIPQEKELSMDIFYYLRYFAVQILRVIKRTTAFGLPHYLKNFDASQKKIFYIEHHLAHAASAYYTSGFNEKTLVVTSDGSGDGLSTTVWLGENNLLKPLYKVGREGSLGAFYGTVTEALGWQVSDGEGKTMGLAPYGNTKKTRGKLEFICPHYKNGKLIRPYNWGWPGEWHDQGAVHWHFNATGKVAKLVEKFGRENIAAEAQRILERELLEIIRFWQKKTGAKYLAVSGGVFLNVKANQKIKEANLFKDLFFYPDPGDSGVATGAALYGYYFQNPGEKIHQLENLYWGPEYSNSEIETKLKIWHSKYKKLSNTQLSKTVSRLLAEEKIIGWFQGRMEAGPRALGNRSILMDPRKAENKDIINSTVKYREAFRPFCPSLLEEEASNYLENAKKAPFMIVSFNVKKNMRQKIPAVVHVDGTVRPQTVTREQNPLYYDLIKAFGKRTGIAVLLNTSFNIKGEPIVCSPEDAIKCFYSTGMDYLVLDNFLIKK